MVTPCVETEYGNETPSYVYHEFKDSANRLDLLPIVSLGLAIWPWPVTRAKPQPVRLRCVFIARGYGEKAVVLRLAMA
jgi:hypothetical protein